MAWSDALLLGLAGLALPPGLGAAQAGPSIASLAMSPVRPASAARASRGDPAAVELDRLQTLGRAQPDVAATELLRYADTLGPGSPYLLEALMELGAEYVNLSRGDQVEQLARRIEALAEHLPLARPAAMLLRGHWLQMHDEVSKAERQFIEASALMPPDAPLFLRLRLLVSYADVKSRGGHYDEALARYNAALELVDDTGPAWRRADLRGAIARVMLEAGQTEKAAEFNREQMRIATAAGDELGMSRAYAARAIQLSDGPDSAATLGNWHASLEHAQLAGNKGAIALGLANVADYYLMHGDFATAYEMSQAALPMAREINSESAQSVALANIGLALISMKRKDEGLPLVRESMAIDERSGSARAVADSAEELGKYLEQAGYVSDALAAYRQYRQLSDELNQQDRQRALIELQEGFANERRQHELDMLAREGRIKDEQILHDELRLKQWMAAGLASLPLLAIVTVLARRLRLRNAQLSVSNEQLRLQAEIDPLTGLSNRHHLQVVMARRPDAHLAGTLYLIDIDHFKQINDQCGHAGGDAVLVEIAARLRSVLREDDLVARWGGEEFLVLVRTLTQDEAEALAQRLLCALAESPVLHQGRPVTVSASIGFGVFPLRTSAPRARVEVDHERAIALADTAMYLAKARGRNAACGIRRVAVETSAQLDPIAQALETAWREGRVELHLQPGPALRGAAA